jgi:hypothetical protein
VESFEYPENLFVVATIDADSVIADSKLIVSIGLRMPVKFDLDSRRIIEFDGVFQQILEYLPEQDRIGLDDRPIFR